MLPINLLFFGIKSENISPTVESNQLKNSKNFLKEILFSNLLKYISLNLLIFEYSGEYNNSGFPIKLSNIFNVANILTISSFKASIRLDSIATLLSTLNSSSFFRLNCGTNLELNFSTFSLLEKLLILILFGLAKFSNLGFNILNL